MLHNSYMCVWSHKHSSAIYITHVLIWHSCVMCSNGKSQLPEWQALSDWRSIEWIQHLILNLQPFSITATQSEEYILLLSDIHSSWFMTPFLSYPPCMHIYANNLNSSLWHIPATIRTPHYTNWRPQIQLDTCYIIYAVRYIVERDSTSLSSINCLVVTTTIVKKNKKNWQSQRDGSIYRSLQTEGQASIVCACYICAFEWKLRLHGLKYISKTDEKSHPVRLRSLNNMKTRRLECSKNLAYWYT